MVRMGGMYGPDATFLGVPKADLADPGTWAGADVLIIGAPFDGGTSYRAGARFGPQAIRFTWCEAGRDHGELHDLFLEDGHAERTLENVLHHF